MAPPKVVFDTKIYHPNIGKWGYIQIIWAEFVSISWRKIGLQPCKLSQCCFQFKAFCQNPTLMILSITKLQMSGNRTKSKQKKRPKIGLSNMQRVDEFWLIFITYLTKPKLTYKNEGLSQFRLYFILQSSRQKNLGEEKPNGSWSLLRSWTC